MVGGRWRDEERFGSVSEFFFFGRRGFVGFFSFGRVRLMFFGNFLKRGECCDLDIWVFFIGRFYRLRGGEFSFYFGFFFIRLILVFLALKSSYFCFGLGGFWWFYWGENWCGGNFLCLEGDGGGRNSEWVRKN